MVHRSDGGAEAQRDVGDHLPKPRMPILPFKLNQDRRHHFPRQQRRVTNWPAYDASLRQRGSLTVWFTDEVRHFTWRWIPFAERRGLEEMTLGPAAYSMVKARRDNSMPSKREQSEDAYGPVPQGPRDMVRTGLFEPQPPAMQAYIPRHSVLCRATAIGRQPRRRPNLPRGGRWDVVPFKGADEAPTSRSTRPAPRECGIARRAARRRATEPP